MIDMHPDAIAERRETVTRLTAAGYTAHQIGKLMGLTERSIVRIRKASGISRPFAPRVNDDEKTAMRELLDDGVSYAEAARTVGRSPWTVARNFPGRGWTRQQIDDALTARRQFGAVLR